jgi:hypothetical protein
MRRLILTHLCWLSFEGSKTSQNTKFSNQRQRTPAVNRMLAQQDSWWVDDQSGFFSPKRRFDWVFLGGPIAKLFSITRLPQTITLPMRPPVH